MELVKVTKYMKNSVEFCRNTRIKGQTYLNQDGVPLILIDDNRDLVLFIESNDFFNKIFGASFITDYITYTYSDGDYLVKLIVKDNEPISVQYYYKDDLFYEGFTNDHLVDGLNQILETVLNLFKKNIQAYL